MTIRPVLLDDATGTLYAGGSSGSTIQEFLIGNGSATSFVVNHALNNQWPLVQVAEAAGTLKEVNAQVVRTDANNVTVDFNTAPTTNQYKVTVVG